VRTQAAVDHFGNQAALARALGIKQQSVQDWGEDVPPLRQLQIEKITDGALKADPSILASAPDPAPQQAASGARTGQMRG
jgi:transcriptional repressor of cell division inhibition gene dicB